MAKKKTGTLEKVSEAIKDAAHTVNDKVVQPAAEALGLTDKKKPARKGGASKPARAAAGKKAAAPAARKKTAAKGGAAKKKTPSK